MLLTDTESKLRDYLECMDLPIFRMDVTNPGHLRWLDRNLHIKNAEHHLFDEVKGLIKTLLENIE